MKTFAIGIRSQWNSPNIDLIKVGFHKCEYCDLFYIVICGVGIDIGFVTVE